MKNRNTFFIALICMLFSISTSAQMSGKLQAAMGKNMAGYSTAKTDADFEALANSFKRIADAEPREWLPRYYQAHAIIIGNFNSTADAVSRDARLDLAQVAIDQLRELQKGNPEIEVLQGMLHTSRLVVDPQNRGQEYSIKSSMSVGKALGIDSNNPRARYMTIANEQGSAQFFGKDLQEYCDRAAKLLEQWDELETDNGPFYPSWGKDQTMGIAKSCEK